MKHVIGAGAYGLGLLGTAFPMLEGYIMILAGGIILGVLLADK